MKLCAEFMHCVHHHSDMLGVCPRLHAVTEVKYVARTRTIAVENRLNFLPDPLG